MGSSLFVAAWAATTLSMPAPVLAAPAPATDGAPNSQETCLLERVNAARRAAGVAPVVMATDIVPDVRAHSKYMSNHGFGHMSSAKRSGLLPDASTMTAENVAYWSETSSTCDYIHNMLMDSPGHRANILLSSVRFLAPGVHVDSSGTWVTEVFFAAPGYQPSGWGTFSDDDTSIFQAQIEKLVDAGITTGCGGERFCPDDPVTRGQMAAFLVRALNLPAAGSAGFTDTAGSVFAGDINRLAKAGITSGCTPRRFCPGDDVTRGQMAAFIVRALDL
jgi:hypothetical protein